MNAGSHRPFPIISRHFPHAMATYKGVHVVDIKPPYTQYNCLYY